MFTLFDLASLLFPLVGAVTFATWGYRFLGVGGAIAGSIVGLVLGRLASWWLMVLAFRPVISRIRSRSTEELKVALRDETSFTPNLVLLELKSRNAVTDDDLVSVLEMLRSETRRTLGWAALTSAYPELAARIPGYSPIANRESCAVSVAPLEAEIRERRKSRSDGQPSPGPA